MVSRWVSAPADIARGLSKRRNQQVTDDLVAAVESCLNRKGELDQAKVAGITALLQAGADAGHQGSEGSTALHAAIALAQPEVNPRGSGLG